MDHARPVTQSQQRACSIGAFLPWPCRVAGPCGKPGAQRAPHTALPVCCRYVVDLKLAPEADADAAVAWMHGQCLEARLRRQEPGRLGFAVPQAVRAPPLWLCASAWGLPCLRRCEPAWSCVLIFECAASPMMRGPLFGSEPDPGRCRATCKLSPLPCCRPLPCSVCPPDSLRESAGSLFVLLRTGAPQQSGSSAMCSVRLDRALAFCMLTSFTPVIRVNKWDQRVLAGW